MGATPTPAAAKPDKDALGPMRYLDLLLLALTLPLFIVAGWPIAGWIAAAALYVGQKALAHYLEGKARKAGERGDTRALVGLTTGSMIGRGWLVALTILAVGLGVEEDAGLAAAVLFLAVFTVNFLMSMILRPFEKGSATR